MIILDMLYTMQQLELIATRLNSVITQGSIVTLTGSLGAGKTTLIGALLRIKGVTGPITSPTFSYVNHYNGVDKERFFHFDLYRLDNVQQFVGAGFDEYLERSSAIVFVEWPEVIAPILYDRDHIAISLEYVDDEHRRIVVTKISQGSKHA